MTNQEAVVLCVGIVGVAAIAITKTIFNRKEKQKFDERKEAFKAAHPIDDMVDKASVDNDMLETPEDKALAKEIMVEAKETLNSANNLKKYQEAGDKFLKLYSDLTDGSKDKIKANLLYFKSIEVKANERRKEAAVQQAQNNIIKQHYQHDIDRINAFRKVVEAVKPDAYTLGEMYKGASKLISVANAAKTSENATDIAVDANS